MRTTKETKYLRELVAAVTEFLTALDAEMRLPSDVTRGQRIARLSNQLEIAKDRARFFGLGEDYQRPQTPPMQLRRED